MERLAARGNAAWAIEECQSLSDVELYRFDEQSQRMRVRDIESLRPRQRSILANLIAWRENAARSEDIPARTLLKDGLLVDMARWPPKSVEELNRVKGMPRPVKQHYGDAIVAATDKALNEPVPDDLKRTGQKGGRRYDRDADRPVVEMLWRQAHDQAQARGIDMGVVTSKKEIARVRAKALNGETGQPNRLTCGWRRELLGDMFDATAMKNIHHKAADAVGDHAEAADAAGADEAGHADDQ
jgi:ribonuclease D